MFLVHVNENVDIVGQCSTTQKPAETLGVVEE